MVTADASITFVAEYSCDRRCLVEFDLDVVVVDNPRFSVARMRSRTDDAHVEAHKQQSRVFTTKHGLTVRAVS